MRAVLVGDAGTVFFGWVELVGHFPTHRTMAVLLICATSRHTESVTGSVDPAEPATEDRQRASRRAA